MWLIVNMTEMSQSEEGEQGETARRQKSVPVQIKKVQPPPGMLITADAMHCQQERARCEHLNSVRTWSAM